MFLFLRRRRPDFKARAILVLRLRTANLLYGATLSEISVFCHPEILLQWKRDVTTSRQTKQITEIVPVFVLSRVLIVD